jgi:protein-arginine kinase activator protein McsA
MEGVSPILAHPESLTVATEVELCFIHEFAAECYEFLRDDAFDISRVVRGKHLHCGRTLDAIARKIELANMQLAANP